MTREGITRALARFVINISYNTLAEAVTRRAKNLFLGALGAAIAGRDLNSPQIALELVKGSRGNARILLHDQMASALDAAFVNAALMSATAQEDSLFSFHPAIIVIPTAMAISEQEGSSGAELISAIIAGYEVMGRVHLGGPNITPRFRGVPVFGPFGAAAAAGKLMKLDEDQLTYALGYAANYASGLTECWMAGSMEGKFHAGMAARNGIIAANLAKAGAVASEESLEGKQGFYQAFAGTVEEAENARVDLGKEFLIMKASSKQYPICAHLQIPTDMALRLMKQHHILAEDISEIIERVSYYEATFPGVDNVGPFKNPGQTLLSAQFCTAAAFLGRPVESYRFYVDSYDDREIFALAQKVKVLGEKDREMPEIEVILHNGKTYRMEGEQETLLPTDEKMKAKFNRLTRDFLGENERRRVIEMVMSLEKLSSIREFMSHLPTSRLQQS
jgi:2-methylcitrate dehydratase PrpD